MAIPAFDPNQPYEEVKDTSIPDFDPNQPYEEIPLKRAKTPAKKTSAAAITPAAAPAPAKTPAAPALRMTIAPDQGSLGTSAIGVDKTDITEAQAENNARLQGYFYSELPKSRKSDSEEADYLAQTFYPTDDAAERLTHRKDLIKAVKYYRSGGAGPIPFYVNESDLPAPIVVTADKRLIDQNREDQALEDVPGTFGITESVAHHSHDALLGVGEGLSDLLLGAGKLALRANAPFYSGVSPEADAIQNYQDEHANSGDRAYYHDAGYARPIGNFIGENAPLVGLDAIAPVAKILGAGKLAKAGDLALQGAALEEVNSGGEASGMDLARSALLTSLLGAAGRDGPAAVKAAGAKAVPEFGPSGESVRVSPEVQTDWHGREYRDYTAINPDGTIAHEGHIYSDGPVIAGDGNGGAVKLDRSTADHVRAVAKDTETLDNLAPGEPVDPTKSDGSFAERPVDPELAKQFDEELPPEAEPAPESEDVVTRLKRVLDNAGEARSDQEAIYREERARKFEEAKQAQQPGSGQQAYHGSLAAMKGEHTKADFEDVSGQFTQRDIDDLFDVVTKTQTLSTSGKLSAYGALQDALNGRIPTQSGLMNLQEAFGGDFVRTILKKRTRMQKAVGAFGEAWNLPKELMATADLSAPLRQGLGLIHRPEYRDAMKAMFGHAWSEKQYNEFRNEMKADPDYGLAEEAGLAVTTVDGIGPSEDVFSSHLGIKIADKTPLIGKPVKAVLEGSERAYVGFLNKLRFDTFKTMIAQAEKLGIDIRNNPKAAKGIANYINVMTGRGGLGDAERAAKLLNGIFFSPRLISSRLQILTAPLLAPFGEGFIAKLPKGMRKEAAKSYAGMVGTYVTAISLASAAGYEVVGNPLSSDFGKIKDGKTRIDLGGGLLQFITAGARAAMRKGTAVGSGTTRELLRRGDTPLDNDIRFILNKLHPSLSLVVDQQRGADAVGKPFTWKSALLTRLTPMGVPDIVSTLKEHPNGDGMMYSVLGLLGAGLQNFDTSKKGRTDPFGAIPAFDPGKDAPAAPTEAPAPEMKADIPAFDPNKPFEETTHSNDKAVGVLEGMGLNPTDKGVRSYAQQEYYYEHFKGVAKPGTSPHGDGRAVDIAPSSKVSPEDIKTRMEAHGFKGVTIITKRHGSGPHWHVQWESYEDDE